MSWPFPGAGDVIRVLTSCDASVPASDETSDEGDTERDVRSDCTKAGHHGQARPTVQGRDDCHESDDHRQVEADHRQHDKREWRSECPRRKNRDQRNEQSDGEKMPWSERGSRTNPASPIQTEVPEGPKVRPEQRVARRQDDHVGTAQNRAGPSSPDDAAQIVGARDPLSQGSRKFDPAHKEVDRREGVDFDKAADMMADSRAPDAYPRLCEDRSSVLSSYSSQRPKRRADNGADRRVAKKLEARASPSLSDVHTRTYEGDDVTL